MFRGALLATWVLSLLAGAATLWWSARLDAWSEVAVFERRLARSSALTGLGAMAVSGAPVTFSAACL